MNFVHTGASALALLPMVFSLQGPFVKNSYRCDAGFYTVKNTHTHIGCLNFCWFSKRCNSVTWVKKSRECRLHDSTRSNPSQAMADLRCISTEVDSSTLGPSHPCSGRPCPDTHVCAPAEAASSHVCLPLDATTPVTTTALGATIFAATPVKTTALGATTSAATAATSVTTTALGTTTSAVTASTATAATVVTTTALGDTTSAATASTVTAITTTSATAPDTSYEDGYVYVGCYLDDWDRMINDEVYRHTNMTHDWCLTQCGQGNYIFAGLENRRECFCGNSYDDVKYTVQNEGDCTSPCDGNGSQTLHGCSGLCLDNRANCVPKVVRNTQANTEAGQPDERDD